MHIYSGRFFTPVPRDEESELISVCMILVLESPHIPDTQMSIVRRYSYIVQKETAGTGITIISKLNMFFNFFPS